MPKVSVIIPVYNVEKYVSECLESVINQTLKEIEVICVDDGSQDSSLSILKKYAQKDKRIIVIEQQNSGAAVARNKGISFATGEFVIFMDSDDVYPTDDVLEVLYESSIQNNVFICGGELAYFDQEGKEYDNSAYLFNQEGMVDYVDYQLDYGYTRFVFNRAFLEKNNILFPPYNCFEDPVFFVKALSLAGKFYALKKLVYSYRTSHKEINWDQKRVLDTLSGFEDNLKISGKYHLDKLHKATANRLMLDWFANPIKDYLKKKDKKVFEQLNKTIKQIDWRVADFDLEAVQSKFVLLPQNWWSAFYSVTQTSKHTVFNCLGVKFKIRKVRKND